MIKAALLILVIGITPANSFGESPEILFRQATKKLTSGDRKKPEDGLKRGMAFHEELRAILRDTDVDNGRLTAEDFGALSACCEHLSKPEECIRWGKRAIQSGDLAAEYWSPMLRSLINLNRLDEAAKALELASSKLDNPEDLGGFHVILFRRMHVNSTHQLIYSLDHLFHQFAAGKHKSTEPVLRALRASVPFRSDRIKSELKAHLSSMRVVLASDSPSQRIRALRVICELERILNGLPEEDAQVSFISRICEQFTAAEIDNADNANAISQEIKSIKRDLSEAEGSKVSEFIAKLKSNSNNKVIQKL